MDQSYNQYDDYLKQYRNLQENENHLSKKKNCWSNSQMLMIYDELLNDQKIFNMNKLKRSKLYSFQGLPWKTRILLYSARYIEITQDNHKLRIQLKLIYLYFQYNKMKKTSLTFVLSLIFLNFIKQELKENILFEISLMFNQYLCYQWFIGRVIHVYFAFNLQPKWMVLFWFGFRNGYQWFRVVRIRNLQRNEWYSQHKSYQLLQSDRLKNLKLYSIMKQKKILSSKLLSITKLIINTNIGLILAFSPQHVMIERLWEKIVNIIIYLINYLLVMQKQHYYQNKNKINSFHNSDEEEDLQDQFYGFEEVKSNQCYESSNIILEQLDQDSIQSNNQIMINQDNERKIYKVTNPQKINDFSQQKLYKNLHLYNHSKIDNAIKKPSFKGSRNYKKYISHRTKMNTEKFE